jgi:hypothetical protein
MARSAQIRRSVRSRGKIRRLYPLEVKHRWVGYMVVDGPNEWRLPLPRELADRVVSRNARSISVGDHKRLVENLTSEKWNDQYEVPA